MCSKSVQWIKNIQEGDKVDLNVTNANDTTLNGWKVATVTNIKYKNDSGYKLYLHPHGYNKKYDISIEIVYNNWNYYSDIIKPHNTIIFHHNYISHPQLKICNNNYLNSYSYNNKNCNTCKKTCCLKCKSIVQSNVRFCWECEDCCNIQEYKTVQKILQRTLPILYPTKSILPIIDTIAYYSTGIIIKCSNDSCNNKLIFDNEFQLNASMDYKAR
eukprot:527878_1